ncbi:Cytochrome P450 [Streptoalloteichus tenebrarius]|uniref:Cytochrome P450 n=1 Tax=Streptoalloteichus tenebrarius (strain ATCC 17920 / DSM 40477 / JCM 4838 / CBS 697.72 / NBRC 16177 / NCIMB 11028 / NRRL B-12390 / A12253. 1 / ISP 5477) TaxID=1933 RepID=A0ABT1HWX9_STRSD|nr:cytochrome P450 [Streptoalloteichus tenebrarius]MCP2260026.1 Cytochrome P450 [Streptoalloteichus tenebrarius]BFF03858.1 cytochrome P450 [Streptoalloteichus tenebrarius]
MSETKLSAIGVEDGGRALMAAMAELRAAAPLRHNEEGIWEFFRYQETLRAVSDHETFSSDTSEVIPSDPALDRFNENNFVRMDPPQHRRLRRLVSQAFTPRVIAQLAPRIEAVTAELLDAVAGQRRIDLVRDLAYPLPVIVIAEMLGVPVGDREKYRAWANGLFEGTRGDSLLPSKERMALSRDSILEMTEYLHRHIEVRRGDPRDDLTTKLIEAEVDGERLDDDAITTFMVILLLAGHISTTALLGNMVLCLDENPDVAAEVRADRGLVPATVEETLRLRAPFPRLARVTTREVEVGGEVLPKGSIAMLWVASANRDERQFPDPDRFDPRRDPNPHLSLGHGIHFCLGAPLARMESRIALNAVLDRYSKITVDWDGVRYTDASTLLSASELPLDVVPA